MVHMAAYESLKSDKIAVLKNWGGVFEIEKKKHNRAPFGFLFCIFPVGLRPEHRNGFCRRDENNQRTTRGYERGYPGELRRHNYFPAKGSEKLDVCTKYRWRGQRYF